MGTSSSERACIVVAIVKYTACDAVCFALVDNTGVS